MLYQTVQVHIATPHEQDYLHLALKRADYQKFYPSIWQTVTGKVEVRAGKQENFIQTALREVFEETSLSRDDIQELYNIPYVANFTDYRSNTVHSAPVIGLIASRRDISLSDEHSDYQWIGPSQFDDTFDLYSHKVGASIFHSEILKNPLNPYRLPLG